MAKGPKKRRVGRILKMGMYDDLKDDRDVQMDMKFTSDPVPKKGTKMTPNKPDK